MDYGFYNLSQNKTYDKSIMGRLGQIWELYRFRVFTLIVKMNILISRTTTRK